MKSGSLLKFIIAIGVSELAGIVGSLFTAPSIPVWYAALTKPALTPLAWVFGPVWTTLFVLMGAAAALVWMRMDLHGRRAKFALALFGTQLVLNVLWSALFFGLHNPGAAFIEIIVLWLAILATLIAFAGVSRAAAWLLVPYLLWVGFAGYLNFAIWQGNAAI